MIHLNSPVISSISTISIYLNLLSNKTIIIVHASGVRTISGWYRTLWIKNILEANQKEIKIQTKRSSDRDANEGRPHSFLLLALQNLTFREEEIAVMLAQRNLLVVHPESWHSGCFYFHICLRRNIYICLRWKKEKENKHFLEGYQGYRRQLPLSKFHRLLYISDSANTIFASVHAEALGFCRAAVPHLLSSSSTIRNPTVFQVCSASNESW